MSSFGIPHTAIGSQLGQSLYTNFPNCVNFPYICAHLPTIQPASVSPDLQLGHITPFKCPGTKRAHLHQKSSFSNGVTQTKLQENMLMRSRDQNTRRSLADNMNPMNLTLIFEVKHLSSSSYISTTTVSSLPRNFDQTQTVPVKLKRKLCCNKCEAVENVRPTKVTKALEWLVQNSMLYKEIEIG